MCTCHLHYGGQMYKKHVPPEHFVIKGVFCVVKLPDTPFLLEYLIVKI